METFDLEGEAIFRTEEHVEKILGSLAGGDYTVACWEPGQCSPDHCHPEATEIYFCFSGGGVMRTRDATVDITPGSFVVHPPGELHEFENGSERSLLFRVRYGDDVVSRAVRWRGNAGWEPSADDLAYFGDDLAPSTGG